MAINPGVGEGFKTGEKAAVVAMEDAPKVGRIFVGSAVTVAKGSVAAIEETGSALKATGEAIKSTYDAYKAGVAAEKTISLEQRARELHSLLNPQAQRMRTTAVTTTEEGVTYVSSSENALSKAQKAALKPGEVAAEGAGHAEATGINAAKQAGHTPTATAASRPICPTCAEALKQEGVIPASPLKQ